MKRTTIIVDDEQPARDLIKEYLTTYPEIEVIAECEEGENAVLTINKLKPDFIFLDVQMPECNGFKVLENLKEIPLIIFCTAYEKYALKAFEVSAVDYLLKPYDKKRFDQAVQRILDRGNQSGEMADKIIALLETIRKKHTYAQRLFIQLRGKVVAVDVKDIEWIEAQDDYAQVHTVSGSYLTSQNLTHLESLLDPNLFIRIHRSSMVNLNFIKEVHRNDSGGYAVKITSGRELTIGRSRVELVKKWMV
jgi:two-component system LytT family response regulator